MATVTANCAVAPQQFPPGTPTAGQIRFFLQNLAGNTLQYKDVNVGDAAVFSSVADGDYKVAAQRKHAGGFLGTAVVSDPFNVDSTVTLDVPVTVGPPTVVV